MYAPGPPYCTYGLRVPASCVLYVPEAQGSLPLYCTSAVRVPASGVPYVPRTVAPQALGKVATTFQTMAEYLHSGRGAHTHPAPAEAPPHDLKEAAQVKPNAIPDPHSYPNPTLTLTLTLILTLQFLVLCLDILKGSLQWRGNIEQFERGLSALKALCEGPGGVEIPREKILEFEVPAARGQTVAPLVRTHAHPHALTRIATSHQPPACVSAVSKGRPFCVSGGPSCRDAPRPAGRRRAPCGRGGACQPARTAGKGLRGASRA